MRLLLISALVAPLLGCSMGSEADVAAPGPGGGGEAGADGSDELPRSLTFLQQGQELAPREQLLLQVQASPAAPFSVRFALPSGEGIEPLDAALDRTAVEADEDGVASVTLTAPSSGTTFRVRASVGGSVQTELELTVKDSGSATVLVLPTYMGHRTITTWVASARPGETCAEKPSIPPPDGPPQLTVLAPATQAPEIVDVPAGVPVAITLRSGHFVGGCASIEMLQAGPPDRRQEVEVTVLDRPIDLAATELAISLDLAQQDSAFSQLFTVTRQAIEAELLGSSSDDADALLDALRDGLNGGAREAMDAARKTENWDDVVRAAWGEAAATRLRDSVSVWLSAGAESFAGTEHLLEGSLLALDGRSAELGLSKVAGLAPAQAGFSGSALASWSAYADDTVTLGAELYFSSSRLLTGLAEPVALAAVPDSDSAAEALSLELDCAGLAAALTATGDDPLLSYADCDQECLEAECTDALQALWARGRDATSLHPQRLGITGAGPARVGDAAEVAGIRGSWVGVLGVGADALSSGGELTASESER